MQGPRFEIFLEASLTWKHPSLSQISRILSALKRTTRGQILTILAAERLKTSLLISLSLLYQCQLVGTIIITGGLSPLTQFWVEKLILHILEMKNLKSLIKQATGHHTSWANINPRTWTHSSPNYNNNEQRGFRRTPDRDVSRQTPAVKCVVN